MPRNVATLPQPEYRALEVMSQLPDDHWLLPVTDDRHAPHLRAGEIAVVAPDRSLVLGELHVLMYSNGPSIWALKRVRDEVLARFGEGADVVHIGVLRVPRRNTDGSIDFRYPVALSEGPMSRSYVEQKIVGRVVGIYDGKPFLMAKAPVFEAA